MKPLIALLAIALLAGCASGPRKPQPSILADAGEGAVKVQEPWLGSAELTKAVAAEACSVYNRDAIGPISHRCLDQYCMTKVVLFQCKAR